jgi:hypothetical protein
MRTIARAAAGAAIVLVLLATAACGAGAPASDSPAGVVQTALGKLAAKDIDGLRGLACAGQEDLIRQQLGMAGLGGSGTAELLPGLDTQALLDAITLDVSAIELGQPVETDGVATVPVTGSVKVTFDSAAMKPLLQRVLEQQGRTMTDEQLDALLKTLEQTGQDVPVDQTIRLVRESGAWKICQDDVQVPAAS